MKKYFLNKLFMAFMTLVFVSLITFFVFEIIPGNAAISRLGMNATPEQIKELEEKMGVNDPIFTRFFRWSVNTLKGDLGTSMRFDEPVSALISKRFLVTTELLVITLLLTIIVGVPLSIYIAKHRKEAGGFIVSALSQVGMAIPTFWLGILITIFFGLTLRFFVPSRFISMSENFIGGLRYLFFAALSMAVPRIAVLMRYFGNALMDEMKKPYIRTALSKGVDRKRIMKKHVIKNALIPMLAVLGMMVADILGSIVIVEQIFNIPGLGKLLISAISGRDLPLVQGIVLYITFIVILVHVVLDFVYQLVDPRIRSEVKQ
ncbi:ABC transporter permease [Guggenheimella bovis]